MDVRVAALIALNPEFFERMNVIWQQSRDIEDDEGQNKHAGYERAWSPIFEFLKAKGLEADTQSNSCPRKLAVYTYFKSKRAEWLKEKRDEKGKEASEEGKSDEQRNEAV